jgi:hypothetical protein
MTAFQEQCMEKCRAWFDERKDALEFSLVEGETQDYWVGKAVVEGEPVEIFVYEDEAGLMFPNREWVPFEKWDYDSPGELIEDLLTTLARRSPTR